MGLLAVVLTPSLLVLVQMAGVGHSSSFFSPSLLEGVVFITASPLSFGITSHIGTFNIPYIPPSFGLAIAFYYEPHLFSSTTCWEDYLDNLRTKVLRLSYAEALPLKPLKSSSPVVRHGQPVPRAFAHWLQHILVAIGLLRWFIAHHYVVVYLGLTLFAIFPALVI